ncbi:hypothetical protein P4S64_20385 [Vibrio sp. M60_M31a]
MSQPRAQTVELSHTKTKRLGLKLRKILKVAIALLAIIAAGVYTYMLQPRFASPQVKVDSYRENT